MIVFCRNALWELDMPFMLYQEWKEKHPERIVMISELTASTYKRHYRVPIREVFDWSIYRNQCASGND